MALPEELERTYHKEIIKFEEEQKMQYITTAERIGIEKGKKEGIEKGIKEGKKETAVNLLKMGIDIKTVTQATGLSEKEIKELAAGSKSKKT